MSYCRFSCLNFYSEAYVYLSFDGYIVHIAGNRQPMGAPPSPFLLDFIKGREEDYKAASCAHSKWMDSTDFAPIEHPMAGESKVFETAKECADFLASMEREGFVIPSYAIMDLLSEAEQAPPESLE